MVTPASVELGAFSLSLEIFKRHKGHHLAIVMEWSQAPLPA